MKKILMVIVMVMCASNCFADCKDIAKMSQTIMFLRQNEVLMYEQYDAVNEMKVSEDTKRLLKQMIKIAYDVRLYDTEKEKQLISIEFGNYVFLQCSNAVENE